MTPRYGLFRTAPTPRFKVTAPEVAKGQVVRQGAGAAQGLPQGSDRFGLSRPPNLVNAPPAKTPIPAPSAGAGVQSSSGPVLSLAPRAQVAEVNPPPHPRAAELRGDVQIGSNATPYARRAIEIALSQLGVYGGDPQVDAYTGGINTNWCKAFVVWAYSQTGQSEFLSPTVAWTEHRKTDQRVMGDYGRTYRRRGARAYHSGNAGTPETYLVNDVKQYRFETYAKRAARGERDLLAKGDLSYRPKPGDMIDIVNDSGSGHSVMVVNADNWPMITTIEGNTLDRARRDAEGMTRIISDQKGKYGGMVALRTRDMRRTPVIAVWDMSHSQKKEGGAPSVPPRGRADR